MRLTSNTVTFFTDIQSKSQSLMETSFLDRLANQLKANKSATCRRAIQRILVRMKQHCETGQYQSTTDAEKEFRRLVESDLACK